jgi:alpha,alpha-trehalase
MSKFRISVSDPQKIGEGYSAYVSYKVTSSLSEKIPGLDSQVYSVIRRFNDFSWLLPLWDSLLNIATFRLRNLWFDSYGLGAWLDSMESGADNNVSALEYPHGTVLAADLNTFLAQEFKALGLIAAKLGKQRESDELLSRSQAIRDAMMKHLWSADDQIFYNLFTASGKHVKRVTYSSFVPLWAGFAPEKEARDSIERYLLNPDHLESRWGIRTLSKQDPVYNNINMIKPHSNWQGPIWPIANYLYMHALIRYGFQKEATELAQTISRLVISDIDKTGGMH